MMNETPGTTIIGYPENLATLLRQNGVDIPDFRDHYFPEVRRRIWFHSFQHASNEYFLLKESFKAEYQTHTVLNKKLIDDWKQNLPDFTAPAITPTSWHSLPQVRKAIKTARNHFKCNPVQKQYDQIRAWAIKTWLEDLDSFAAVLGAQFFIIKSMDFEPSEDEKNTFWDSFYKGVLPSIRSSDGRYEWRAMRVGDTTAFQKALVIGELICPLTLRNTKVEYLK